jgi:hypothetical protein
MAKKPEQMQMDGIDKTPFAENLTKAGKIIGRINTLEEQLQQVNTHIQDEMNKKDLLNVTHNDYHFKLERTGPKQASVKLKIKKVTTKSEK